MRLLILSALLTVSLSAQIQVFNQTDIVRNTATQKLNSNFSYLNNNKIGINQANTYGAFLQRFDAALMRLPERTVVGLPAAASSTNYVFVVTNGTSAADCTVGGGTTRALCISNGAAWVPLGGNGGGGGATTISQLTDFAVTKTSGTVETIGATCTAGAPCLIRIGGAAPFRLTTSPTVTLSGTSNSATVYWYLSSANVLTVGHNSTTTLTCSAGCSVATGITGPPADSVPLWATTFTANAWDAITEAMDNRSAYSRVVIAPGSGISSTSDPTTGIQTLTTDPTIVPRYFTGSGAPGGSCTSGRDFYTRTDTPYSTYDCENSAWVIIGGSSSQTRYETFPLCGDLAGTRAVIINGSNMTAGCVGLANSGPNSTSYNIDAELFTQNSTATFPMQASSTWSAAAGTIDILATWRTYEDATTSHTAGVYIGCQAAGGSMSYGTVAAISWTSPTLNTGLATTTATPNIPGSCAASTYLQVVIQRTDMTGDDHRPALEAMTVVIRGN